MSESPWSESDEPPPALTILGHRGVFLLRALM